jgi:DNA-dependent metalloprotease WSS1
VHGPHDSAFYAFLSKLEDEYAALKRSGYAGEGFFSPGQRLGQNISHDVPPHLARLKALEAAEKRKRLGQMMGSGRLGGSGPGNLTPRDLAAQVRPYPLSLT